MNSSSSGWVLCGLVGPVTYIDAVYHPKVQYGGASLYKDYRRKWQNEQGLARDLLQLLDFHSYLRRYLVLVQLNQANKIFLFPELADHEAECEVIVADQAREGVV